MTSSDRNEDLVTSQEKLEWVTPKISLMSTVNTEGNKVNFSDETGGPMGTPYGSS